MKISAIFSRNSDNQHNNNIKLIVGLGNFPREYYLTRHNIGFLTVDKIQETENFENWKENKKLLCNISSGFIYDKKCILIKPTTYMNLSGNSVIKVAKFYKIHHDNIIVIHDDIDLKFGIIRTTNSRNSAGHNGVKSINSHIIEKYNRIKIGIGRPENKEYDISNYVLSNFTKEEQEKIDDIISNSILTIKTIIK